MLFMHRYHCVQKFQWNVKGKQSTQIKFIFSELNTPYS